MTDVLAAYRAVREAEAQAEAMVLAARRKFGQVMYEGRHRPPHLGRLTREAIEDEIAKSDLPNLKVERLRQIEKLYSDTLIAS